MTTSLLASKRVASEVAGLLELDRCQRLRLRAFAPGSACSQKWARTSPVV